MIESMFNQKTIENAIHTKWAGKTVHFAEETQSTNLWAKEIASGWISGKTEGQSVENSGKISTDGGKTTDKKGAEHGTLAVAEFQTAGRGRLGRKWLSPKGSCIMMSLILRPQFEPQYAPMLTLVMGLSVAQAVNQLGLKKEASFAGYEERGTLTQSLTVPSEKSFYEDSLKASIKWPNDVVISNRKICGILTEMSLDGMKIREVVIGVGINVNLPEVAEELKEIATSLYLETGQTWDRNQIIHLVMKQFEDNYEKFIQTLDLTYFVEDYNNLLINKDKKVRVLDPKEPFEGTALGINTRGELLVARDAEGTDEIAAVSAGEVSVRGLYGYV